MDLLAFIITFGVSLSVSFGISTLAKSIMDSSLEKWQNYTGALKKLSDIIYSEMDKVHESFEASKIEKIEDFLNLEENLKYLPLIEAENKFRSEIEYIKNTHSILFFGSPVKKFYKRYGIFIDYIMNLKAGKIKTLKDGHKITLAVEK